METALAADRIGAAGQVGGGLLVVVTSRGEDTGRPVPPDPVSVAIFAFDNAGKIPTCVDFADPGTG